MQSFLVSPQYYSILQMDWRAGLPFITERTIRRVSTQLEEHRDRWNRYSEIWNSAISSMYIVTSICVSKHTITLIFVVGPMVQQLAVHSCEVGLNLLPWIWSRSSLAFHQSLLYLIPGNANGLGKSTFIDIPLPTTFPGSCRALNCFDSRPLPAHPCDTFSRMCVLAGARI